MSACVLRSHFLSHDKFPFSTRLARGLGLAEIWKLNFHPVDVILLYFTTILGPLYFKTRQHKLMTKLNRSGFWIFKLARKSFIKPFKHTQHVFANFLWKIFNGILCFFHTTSFDRIFFLLVHIFIFLFNPYTKLQI